MRFNEITDQEFITAARNLACFYDFTFLAERNTTLMEVLVFVLEYQFVSLGLEEETETEGGMDSADAMYAFCEKMDELAKQEGIQNWQYITPSLPYMRERFSESKAGGFIPDEKFYAKAKMRLDEGTNDLISSDLFSLNGYLTPVDGEMAIVNEEFESVVRLPKFIKTDADFYEYKTDREKTFEAGELSGVAKFKKKCRALFADDK
ncbi:hypothetical protein AB4455_12180 [Vibrio sp. 10N.261.46.E12]|uniref:hypothetical protein n=1 Tax=unclassified Vibrio TaxID=2614977 RepID=UPI0009779FD7|nr:MULTISPECIES: hypothetical protein [unclassified Vibrio]OMO34194.1 hypothetical protein BH584_13325 [Vibrio sp. 10N.261.45.E1]PMJ33157.1 hypothetical protein BCU27_25275 [Vibrio sp. 10N.286.45.B6]PML86353.1 hypothetical protein BCT66_14275 [Vibrio sp. 10N.261.49.E11]PMM77469.1 hypothetical protein BCT48_23715 [Vibrio sp. 10N.261.46.F12]PMM90630.1 hypothetical protein BCT46_03405 [Vibrio sp. 10N.261.46.E8]